MVKAFNATGGYSTPTSALSVLTKPSPVTNLTTSSITATGCEVTWTTVTGATSYSVKAGTGSYQLVPGGAAATTYTVTGLTPGTSTVITVQSSNASGSTEATVSVLTLPAAPADLTSSNATSTSFTLTWTAVPGTTTYYISTDNGATYPITTSNATYDITGLNGGTTYNIYVKAYNSTGYSNPSSLFSFTTSSDPPANLAVSNITYNSYTVTWSLSSGATNYYISINSGPFNVVAGGATASTFSASGVASGAQFNIVVASNSSYTATSSISFYTKPRTVTNVRVTQIKSVSVLVSWNAVSPAPIYYAAGLQNTDGNMLQWIYSTGPFPTNVTFTGLEPFTAYKMIVVAVNPDYSTGVDSTAVPFTTIGPYKPSNLTVTDIDYFSFVVSWTQQEGTEGITYSFTLNGSTPESLGASVSASGTSATFSNVSSGTQYNVIVIATNAQLESTSSNIYVNTPAGVAAGARAWDRIVMSSNGKIIVAHNYPSYPPIGDNGSTIISYDYGNTWIPRNTPDRNGFTNGLAISADGTTIMISFAFSQWISTNSGFTWSEVIGPWPSRNAAVTAICMSSNGGLIVILGYFDSSNVRRVYTSTDFGVSWTLQPGSDIGYSPQYSYWSMASLDCSSDGTKIVAGGTRGINNSGIGINYIYTSTDSGVTWTQRQNSGPGTFTSVSSSVDGNKLVGADFYGNNDNGRIVTSTDAGATWTNHDNIKAYDCASSSDGTVIAGITFGLTGPINGIVTVSTDSGNTWTQRVVPSGTPTSLISIAMSSDGKIIVTSDRTAASSVVGGNSTAYLWISTNSGETWRTL
jgi:hypothetical protein